MITSAQYTVDGTPIKILSTAIGHRTAVIHNIGSKAAFLSGSNTVSVSNGFYFDKAAGVVYVKVSPDEELWALAETGQTTTVTVLVTDE